MSDASKDNPKTIFGWCMYDWANSAYSTTVVGGLLPTFFAAVIVGSGGVTLAGIHFSATALWAFAVGVSSLVAFLISPVLGAVADFTSAKKRFLLFFAYQGSVCTSLLFFSGDGDVMRTLLLFLLAQVGFISANVFYDAFLPDIASAARMDWISGKGYSFGYVGGGLQFALSLGLIAGRDLLGMSLETATRAGILMAAMWWAGFTLYFVRLVDEPRRNNPVPERFRDWPRVAACAAVGFSRTWQTARTVGRRKHLALFLVAFMLYNDGIQTVIEMAAIYGADELRLSTTALLLTLLLIQGVATIGSVVFGWLAQRIGARRAIMVSLVIWSAATGYAYFIETTAQYFGLGVVVGLVLGGSQALSRSFYSSMIPAGASAEFFGFYTVFSKFSAIWGPFLFGFIRQWSGSSRLAIVSLVVLFVAGLILLALVDEQKAREAT